MTDRAYPTVMLLAMPTALSRSMAHALMQAHQQEASPSAWQCLAPQPGDSWPENALVYLLGQDWRDADPDPALTQPITAWRAQLSDAGQPYVMLYGKPSAQWLQLAESLKSIAPSHDWNWISSQNPWKPSTRMHRSGCEQCGDPECEKTLFEALKSAP